MHLPFQTNCYLEDP